MKVLVLVTSSVSVKLLSKLITALKERGNEVRYVMTEKANIFNVTCGYNKDLDQADNYSKYTDYNTEVFAYHSSETKDKVIHVELAHWADVILIAPATANTLAKLNHGICDNVIMDTLLVASGLGRRIVAAPAMNTHMWKAWQTERNIASLKDQGVQIVYPTVKRLACGDYGVGALADVKAIVDRVEGIRWRFPVNTDLNNKKINVWPHPGSFGAVRKHEVHNGVDIYCGGEVDVYAVESGEVVEVGKFTGAWVKSDWWEETMYAIVKGRSGYVVYGEIAPHVYQGESVTTGKVIGHVIPVLKPGKERPDIPGHSRWMLHIELRKELLNPLENYEVWHLNEDRPKALLDPTAYLI